jgi:hypothetical protein
MHAFGVCIIPPEVHFKLHRRLQTPNFVRSSDRISGDPASPGTLQASSAVSAFDQKEQVTEKL